MLDHTGNGKVNALDARFANLRIWRDANQDGISQASELMENVVPYCRYANDGMWRVAA